MVFKLLFFVAQMATNVIGYDFGVDKSAGFVRREISLVKVIYFSK